MFWRVNRLSVRLYNRFFSQLHHRNHSILDGGRDRMDKRLSLSLRTALLLSTNTLPYARN